MEQSRIIEFAIELGWGVRDLNDNDAGLVVKGPRFQVYNDYMPKTGQTFWTEDEAWQFIVSRIRGGVMPDQEDVETPVTGQRGQMFTEMMSYRHPGLTDVPKRNQRGNIYALTQRKQGSSPSFYTMTIGVEIPEKLPMNGFMTTSHRPFVVPCEGFDPVSQEVAIKELYGMFQAWKLATVDTEE